jgi:hypothetical protein
VIGPSPNFACLHFVGDGAGAGLPRMNIDSVRLEEDIYTNAAKAFVGRMKPEVSTHDTTMQGLGALLGNSTVIKTAGGELDTRSLPSSRRKHRVANNRLFIGGNLNAPPEEGTSKKKAKTNLYPGGAPPPGKDPSRDSTQDASHRVRLPFASIGSPSADASFIPTRKGSNSLDPIFIDSSSVNNENCFFQRGQSGHSGRSAADLVQGAKRRSLEPSAAMIFSCESDEEDEKVPASTPVKKKGIARLSYMSKNRELTADIAQGVIDMADDKGKEPNSQDLCEMIDQIIDSN